MLIPSHNIIESFIMNDDILIEIITGEALIWLTLRHLSCSGAWGDNACCGLMQVLAAGVEEPLVSLYKSSLE